MGNRGYVKIRRASFPSRAPIPRQLIPVFSLGKHRLTGRHLIIGLIDPAEFRLPRKHATATRFNFVAVQLFLFCNFEIRLVRLILTVSSTVYRAKKSLAQ